jgi:hypothetical protein
MLNLWLDMEKHHSQNMSILCINSSENASGYASAAAARGLPMAGTGSWKNE